MPKLKPRRSLRKGKRRGHPERRKREAILRTLIQKHRGVCHYCGEAVNLVDGSPLQATVDHVVPVSKGGLDRLDNLVLACQGCNHDKADALPDGQ